MKNRVVVLPCLQSRKSIVVVLLCLLAPLGVFAQGTAFTYQGQLTSANAPATGNFDLSFALFDAASSGAQQGNALTNAATAVSNGLFTVTLDFGNQFPGADRWLEIGVRTNGGGAFATLSPRQLLTATPYAVRAANANTANSAVTAASATTANSVAAANVAGTLADGQLSTNVALLNTNASFAGDVTALGDVRGARLNVGTNHTLTGASASIAGGRNNTVASDQAFIGAGQGNNIGVNSSGSVIGGGISSSIFTNSAQSVIGGGVAQNIQRNSAFSTIAGGYFGFIDVSSPWATIGGGQNNTARGVSATIPGGTDNAATNYAFAAGRRAKADHTGAFVWADSTNANFASTTNDQFNVRAAGGARFVTSGAGLTVDGASVFTGLNGAGLTNLNAAQLASGTVPLAQLPGAVVTNGASSVNLSGTFSGNVSGAMTWGTFNLASSPAVGVTPYTVTAADVNGDGKLDLISANNASWTLTVLTNTGSGGFGLSSSPTVGSYPWSVISMDVNGDGKADLISGSQGLSSLTVLTNNGIGGFVISSSPGVGAAPYDLASTDVNGDGRPDIISANFEDDKLTILTNNGSGSFMFSSSPPVGNGPYAVVSADVNGDGKPDLISADSADDTLTVLTNNGSGSFVFSSSLPVGNFPKCVMAADVNRDGKADLISGNHGANTLTVLTNNGSGGFLVSSLLVVGNNPRSLAFADVNADGRGDIITSIESAGTLVVLTNRSSGDFVLSASLPSGTSARSVIPADVNGDGQPDLINANIYPGAGTLSVFINTPTFTGNGSGLASLNASQLSSGTVPLAQLPGAVVTNGESGVNISGTFSGNGSGLTNLNAAQLVSGTVPLALLPGAVVTNGESGVNISGTFSGNGAGVTNVLLGSVASGGAITWGTFVFGSSPGVGDNPQSVASADVNGDGKPDLISANFSANTLTVLTNNGSGGFGLSSSPTVNGNPISATSADVNGDGKADLISANFSANTLTVLLNNGSGGFVLSSSPAVGNGPYSVTAADLNGDGKPDLVSANGGPGTLTVLTNNGSGGFVVSSSPAVGVAPSAVTAADVNGDGKVDLISTTVGANALTVLTNNGSGGFVLSSSPAVGNGPYSVTAADLNGDGKPDLVSANGGPGTLTVLTNNGSGGFVVSSSPAVGGAPSAVTAADVNGDGKADLISANQDADNLTVYLNTPTFSGNGSGLTNLNAANLTGTISSAQIADGTIVNADVNPSAAIAYSKLNLAGSIVNADVSPSAAIADTKLATLSTAGKVADTALSANVALLNRTPQSFTGTNTFGGNVGIGTTSPAALLQVNGTVGIPEHIRLSGRDVYLGGGDTNGVSIRLGVSVPNNRQLWIGDSANVTQGSTNAIFRVLLGNGGYTAIGSITSDGTAVRPLVIESGANLGVGTTTPATVLDVNGNATTRGFNIVTATASVPGAGATLTATSGYVVLNPAGPVTLNGTTAITAGTTAGQMLILRGSSDVNTVTINDNAGTALGANRVLGANDILSLVWTGSLWAEISFANN